MDTVVETANHHVNRVSRLLRRGHFDPDAAVAAAEAPVDGREEDAVTLPATAQVQRDEDAVPGASIPQRSVSISARTWRTMASRIGP